MEPLREPEDWHAAQDKAMSDKILARLVENAFDFLERPIDELREHPKYSVIHFYSAVELFLKARLLREHWSIVVKKDPDWSKFKSGDFISVNLREAANRLAKIARSPLPKSYLETFNAVGKHRNRMVHFYHGDAGEKGTLQEKIVKEQLRAWYFLQKLLSEEWKDVFAPWEQQSEAIGVRLRGLKSFLQVVYDCKKTDIEKKISQGIIFEICPSCGFHAQEHHCDSPQVYTASCLVCDFSQSAVPIICPQCEKGIIVRGEGFYTCERCEAKIEPEDIAEALESQKSGVFDKDDDWRGASCGDCGGVDTVVKLEDGRYFCTNCFEKFDTVEYCEWCNEPNPGELEDSYIRCCQVCERLLGGHLEERD